MSSPRSAHRPARNEPPHRLPGYLDEGIFPSGFPWVIVRLFRRVPLTTGLAGALVATSLVKRRVDGAALERAASTNIDNLMSRPVRSLLASAVVLEGDQWVASVAGTAAALGVLEYQAGSRRAAAVAVAGHVLPTLATQAAVWAGIRVGRLPESARKQIDLGASYVVTAAVGSLVTVFPRRQRRIASAIATAAAMAEVAVTREVVAAGHGIAFAVGYLGRWRQPSGRRSGSATRASHSL